MTGSLAVTLGVAGAATASAGVCVHHAAFAVRSQWLGPAAWRGSPDLAAAALTFDDGPAGDTERILDTLAAHRVRAAFFLIGRQVERHPALARRIVADGHDVGNHSYSHPVFLYCSARETRRQLERTQQVIADTTGVTPVLARPPCGVRTPAYFKSAAALGLRTVLWSVAGFDWKARRAEQIAMAVVDGLSAGAIVLLHDGDSENRRDRRQTAEAVPRIIDAAAARGLRVRPLADLLDGDASRARQGSDV